MAYSVNWATKVVTVPLTDLTLVSGFNYTLDTGDFWIEMRRLEASAGDGLWAEQVIEYANTQLLSGLTYSAIVKMINGYTWNTDTTNKNISLLGFNSNLLDTFIPGSGISVLANNSAGKQTITSGSGLDAAQDQKLTDIDVRTIDIDLHSLEMWRTLGLEVGNTITITPTGIVAQDGTVIVNFTGDGVTSTIMNRQA